MAGGMSIKGLEELRKNLSDTQSLVDNFCEGCAKELATRLLALVIKRTPVGVYPPGTGLTGGTLRRGWTSESHGQAMYTAIFGGGSGGTSSTGSQKQVYGKGALPENVKGYADSLKVRREGDLYVIEITNPVEYASYVEFGHRTRNHKGWVKGHFMLTLSEKEIQRAAPAILQKKINRFLKGVFG